MTASTAAARSANQGSPCRSVQVGLIHTWMKGLADCFWGGCMDAKIDSVGSVGGWLDLVGSVGGWLDSVGSVGGLIHLGRWVAGLGLWAADLIQLGRWVAGCAD